MITCHSRTELAAVSSWSHRCRTGPRPRARDPDLQIPPRARAPSQVLTEEQRRRTVDAALEWQRHDAPISYGVFRSNCEHLAWQIDASGLGASGRWVSPQVPPAPSCEPHLGTSHPASHPSRNPAAPAQVPHNLWILFRLGLQLVGAGCLYALASTPSEDARALSALRVLYHVFMTLPIGAQVQACLVRTAVNLTQRQRAGELEPGVFEYLMVKEGARACVVLLLSMWLVLNAPEAVREPGGHGFCVAAALSLLSHNIALRVFNVAAQIVIRALLAAGIGCPVPVFDDLRVRSGALDDARLLPTADRPPPSAAQPPSTDAACADVSPRHPRLAPTSTPHSQARRGRSPRADAHSRHSLHTDSRASSLETPTPPPTPQPTTLETHAVASAPAATAATAAAVDADPVTSTAAAEDASGGTSTADGSRVSSVHGASAIQSSVPSSISAHRRHLRPRRSPARD